MVKRITSQCENKDCILSAPQNNVDCIQALEIFENAAVSLWNLDFSQVVRYLEDLKEQGVKDFRFFFMQNPSEVLSAFSKVIVKNANSCSVELFEAADKSHLLANLKTIAGMEAFAAHTASLMALVEQKKIFEHYAVYRTLFLKPLHVMIRWWSISTDQSYSDVMMTILDITRFKEQNGLLNSYQKGINASIDAMAFGDLDGKLTYVNPAFYKTWGYLPEDKIVGRSVYEFWRNPQEAKKVVLELYEKGNYTGELVGIRKDGTSFDAQLSATLVHDENNCPAYLFSSFADITENKKIQARILETEQQFHRLVEMLPNAILLMVDSKIVYANPSAAGLFGADTAADMNRLLIKDIIHTYDLELIRNRIIKTEVEQRILPLRTISIVRSNGTLADVEVVFIPFQYNRTPAVAGIFHDITRQKQDQLAILSQQTRLRSLVHQLVSVEELERRHIAAELHDNIGQSMILAKMKLDQMIQKNPTPYGMELREVSGLLEKLAKRIEKVTFDLSSPTLFTFGMETALREWYEETILPHKPMQVRFDIDSPIRTLSEPLQQFLFRSAKELVMNVLKHAGAQHVTVQMVRLEDYVRLEVTDDGSSFSSEQLARRSPGRGYGLLSIRERVQFMGGTFSIDSNNNGGARIILSIPSNKEIK